MAILAHQTSDLVFLLFFNSPDCEDCRRVKGYMAASEHFAGMTGEGSARRPPATPVTTRLWLTTDTVSVVCSL